MKSTTDLWLAAFIFRGNPALLVGITKVANKAQFQFKVTEEQWTALKIDFTKSEASELKYTIEKLKDLMFQ